jgi:hypothetical protein
VERGQVALLEAGLDRDHHHGGPGDGEERRGRGDQRDPRERQEQTAVDRVSHPAVEAAGHELGRAVVDADAPRGAHLRLGQHDQQQAHGGEGEPGDRSRGLGGRRTTEAGPKTA